MIHKTRGIVLKTTHFKENSVIAHIFTQSFGVQSYIIHGVRNQKGAIRPSHLMPLNLVDVVVYKKPAGGIQQMKELRCNPILTSIHFNLLKNSISMFLTEILDACLTQEDPNEDLFDFLQNFITVLDLENGKLANYPSYFLMQLTGFLGFQPKGVFNDKLVFNLKEGIFIAADYDYPYCVDKEHSEWWWKMQHSTLSDWLEMSIPKRVRDSLLNQLLVYYELHGLHGRKIKSHEILKTVMR